MICADSLLKKKDITELSATITGSDAIHMRKVLRMTKGQQIELVDDSGCEYRAEITGISSDAVAVTILDMTSSGTESPIRLIVAQAFLKDRKMDMLFRQFTELGVSFFFPFAAERSIARPDKNRLSARMERWRKIAKESVKQCKRTMIPEIGPALSFEETLHFGDNCDMRVVFWEKGRTPLSHEMMPRNAHQREVMLMLGPEGGFSFQEIEKAEKAGFTVASLGPRILKAETAPIVSCAIIQYLFGDMGNKLLDKQR